MFDLNQILHVVSLVVYLAATAALVLMIVSRTWREQDPQARLARIVAYLRIYDPASIALLGILVMTGAFRLTAFKSALREQFYEQVGRNLAWKLFAVFFVINVAAYIAFGIGHRLVRRFDDPESAPDPVWVDSMLRRLTFSAVLVLVLTLWTVWIALR